MENESCAVFVCNQTFSSTKSLQMRIVTVHEGAKPFECTVCNQNFPKKHSMLRHVSLLHNWFLLTPCKCHICGNKYPSDEHKSLYCSRPDTNEAVERKKFNCKICESSNSWRSSLQKHYRSDHIEELQRENTVCTVLCAIKSF